jgi:hypothetical protein
VSLWCLAQSDVVSQSVSIKKESPEGSTEKAFTFNIHSIANICIKLEKCMTEVTPFHFGCWWNEDVNSD